MQSKVSWFKRGIVTQDLRNVGWIGIIYLIALLFTVPLQIIMMHQAGQLPYKYDNGHYLFSILDGLQMLLMFTVPVILSVILFRYLQVKVPADFIHSLPIKRTTLFHHHAFIGIFLLVIPVIITAILIGIVHGTLGLEKYFSALDIAKWAGLTIVINMFVFALTTLIGAVTGISAVSVVLTYIFLVFPAGIMILLYGNVKYFIYGFAYDYYLGQNIQYLTPIAQMAEIGHRSITAKAVLIYIVLSIIFYLLGIFAYKKRQIEVATQAIAFRYLKPIFKYGVTFCFMLLSGMYFGETQQGALGWRLFGYIFGSVFGYIVAEMVLQKTWRIFREMKGYLLYAVAVAALGLLLSLDMTGYEKKLPDAAEIERAYFGYSATWFKNEYPETPEYVMPVTEYSEVNQVNAINESNRYFFNDPENINSIMKLHQQLIEDGDQVTSRQSYQQIVVAYELKNGSKLVRQYEVPESSYEEQLKPIYESQEYRYSNNELLRLKEEIKIDKIAVDSNSVISKKFNTVDPKQIEEIINALKSDMLEEPYADIVAEREPWGEIELLLENNQRLYIPWKKSYHQFDNWLMENNLLEQARVVPEDLMFVAIIKNKNTADASTVSGLPIESRFKNNEKPLIIEDPSQLEECLYEASWHWDGEYLIAIYYKDNKEPSYHGLENVPTFVAERFK
ncbi:MAG TPA: multidrug ABC transporter permease [Bacillales bacterium]|nr:multidrug ABC transporter permease [Bacillales bacterium]